MASIRICTKEYIYTTTQAVKLCTNQNIKVHNTMQPGSGSETPNYPHCSYTCTCTKCS